MLAKIHLGSLSQHQSKPFSFLFHPSSQNIDYVSLLNAYNYFSMTSLLTSNPGLALIVTHPTIKTYETCTMAITPAI